MASHLRTTVRELSERITFRELQDWLEYLEWEELRRRTKDDFYLAQIAHEVRRSYVRHPNREKFSTFLYQPPDVLIEREQRMKASKASWFSALKMKTPDKKA